MPRRLAAMLLLAAPDSVAAFGRLFPRHDAARVLEQSDEDPSCVDKNDNCGLWSNAGECDANPGYMKANCAKACNKCKSRPYIGREERAKCTDANRECKRWAQEEECTKNPTFMNEQCRQSCFACQSLNCWDAHPECADWARNGQCQNNSDFMFEEVSATSPALQRGGDRCVQPPSCALTVGAPPGSCPPQCKFSCRICNVNFKAECRRDKNMKPMAVPGTIDETFELALRNFPHFKPTVLHRDPWVLHFENFLNMEEVDHVISTAGARFERSLAGDGVTPVRTSATSWCNVESCLRDLRFQEIRQRISNLTRVPWENAEHLQVLRYEPGQFYREHHDQNSPKNSAWGPRLYTFFMYLSDVEKGGETRFTKLNISVAPKKGSAILWPSVFSDDPWSTDDRTYHEACTVEMGTKYSANFWIHMFEFQQALGRGCDNSDYYQDVMAPAHSKGPKPQPRRH